MLRKCVWIIAVLLASQGARAEPTGSTTLKAVMQINSQNMVVILRGLRDADEIADQARAAGWRLDLRVIIYGAALDLFEKGADADLRTAFEKLTRNDGVHLLAGERTLQRVKRTLKNLLPGFATAPSGPFEVLRLEREGYLYLKP